MFSLKLILIISTAVIFAAVFGTKSSLPSATTFFLLCFTPPYLFITVNAIIISIVASSKFHQYNSQPILVLNTVVNNSTVPILEEEEEEIKQIDFGIFPVKSMDSPESFPVMVDNKPLVSTRFTHRKPLKSIPKGGKVLRVTKQKRHETMENTWKAITEGRSMPLKKRDTWQTRYDVDSHEHEDSTNVNDIKFNKTWKLRKEPSLSQEELNKRVEAFIRKFNHQMRLQRQESLNHMINNNDAT